MLIALLVIAIWVIGIVPAVALLYHGGGEPEEKKEEWKGLSTFLGFIWPITLLCIIFFGSVWCIVKLVQKAAHVC
jgi:hypothetical protein